MALFDGLGNQAAQTALKPVGVLDQQTGVQPGVEYGWWEGLTLCDPLESSAVERYQHKIGKFTWKCVLSAPQV